MKETVITPRHKKRELYVALACFSIAYILNIIGIVKFGTPASELLTGLPLVLLVTLVLYVVQALFRLLLNLITNLWKRKRDE